MAEISRRAVLAGAAAIAAGPLRAHSSDKETTNDGVSDNTKVLAATQTYEQYIKSIDIPPHVINGFRNRQHYSRFDSRLGYVLNEFVAPDGINNTKTIFTSRGGQERSYFVYPNKRPRINTYGDSYTQGAQVGNNETWQEYLGGHIAEPIRNFGVGAYGVYQAWSRLRMIEEESSEAAENIIFFIWGDDHRRSLVRFRYGMIFPWFKEDSERGMFHGNFWPNIEMDLEAGSLREYPNRFPAMSQLDLLSDREFLWQQLKDDLALQLFVYSEGWTVDLDIVRVRRLAEILNFPFHEVPSEAHMFPNGESFGLENMSPMRAQTLALLDSYAFAATLYTLQMLQALCNSKGKKLLVSIFDPYRGMIEQFNRGTRYDQPIVDGLNGMGITLFDMNMVHLAEMANYKGSLEDYMNIYLRGHYNPRGNHLFAYAILPDVIKMLDPKPLVYQTDGLAGIDFKRYISGYR